MSFCDTTCTYTFFSVRHDDKTICEGREWTLANGCQYSSHATSPYACYFFSLFWIITWFWWVCLLALFVSGSCFCLLRKWAETLQTHSSVFCAVSGNCCLLIVIMFIALFQNCLQIYGDFSRIMQVYSIFFHSSPAFNYFTSTIQ